MVFVISAGKTSHCQGHVQRMLHIMVQRVTGMIARVLTSKKPFKIQICAVDGVQLFLVGAVVPGENIADSSTHVTHLSNVYTARYIVVIVMGVEVWGGVGHDFFFSKNYAYVTGVRFAF